MRNVAVTEDSMIKYLRRDNLSLQGKEIVTHPGNTTNDMLDYIKQIVRRKSDVLLIHSGTNLLSAINLPPAFTKYLIIPL